MTTNQEGRQAAIRDSTSTAYGVAADWHALFDDAGISAGTFNERLLAWINSELSASYSNLVSAMQAYAEDAGYNGWEDMATLVLAMNGAETLLDGEAQGLALDFTDQSALIIDTGTPANDYDSTGIVSSGALVGPGGKLTYTGPVNGGKLCRQADGYYKYGAHNLYLNSAAPANQSITVVSGASYAVTITGTVSVTASGAATGTWTAGTNTFTAATTTLTLGSTSGSGTVHVYRTPAVTDYVATAGSPVYALPYSYAVDGSCEGLLVEQQRTNLLVGSATVALHAASNTSTLSATITSGQADLSGGTAAGLITALSGLDRHLIYSSVGITVSSGTVYTLSCLMKAGTSQYGHLQIANSGGGAERYGAVFDLSGAGSVTGTNTNSTSPASTATSIESVGNGWYRCSLTMSSSTSTAQFWHIGLSDSATPTWSAASPRWDSSGTETVYYCYPQIEQGSFPTSPIITYGAAATRAADNISIAGTAFPWNGNAGSFVVKYKPIGIPSTGQFVFCADGADDYDLLAPDGAGALLGRIDGTVGNVTLDATYTDIDEHIVALANDSTSFYGSLDGAAVVTDASSIVASSTITFYIGSRNAVATFNGTIDYVVFVPRKLSEAETITKATQ